MNTTEREYVVFSINLRPAERAALEALAAQDDRGISGMVRFLVRGEAERRGIPVAGQERPAGSRKRSSRLNKAA